MRLGGFVIHGNNADTLAECVRSLRAVCDEVVAVDSNSTDGSSQLAKDLGARGIIHPWQGYGSARARAASELSDCDYLFFLDSDEWLEPADRERALGWKDSTPTAPFFTVGLHDWAGTPRFRYRSGTRIRLVRRDRALWTPQMVVHEALPRGEHQRTDIDVQHHFVRDGADGRVAKDDRYALLWAVQAFAENRNAKVAPLQQPAHFVKDLLFKGALFRGGPRAIAIARDVSRYHRVKHEYLAAIRRGEHAELVALYRAEKFEALLAALTKHLEA